MWRIPSNSAIWDIWWPVNSICNMQKFAIKCKTGGEKQYNSTAVDDETLLMLPVFHPKNISQGHNEICKTSEKSYIGRYGPFQWKNVFWGPRQFRM